MDTKDLIIKYGIGTPKRYRSKEKKFFLNEIGKDFQELGYNVQGLYGKKKRNKAANLIIGDVMKADKIIIANYDTPAHNFGNPINYHPFNGPASYRSSFIPTATPLIISAVLMIYIIFVIFPKINFEEKLLFSLFWSLLFILATILPPIMMVGTANKVNFNYNTSGCLAILKTAEKLAPEQRKHVAFVLTDQGCRKFTGDWLLREKLPNIDKKLIIMVDCIGAGDRYAVGYREGTKGQAEKLAECFNEKALRVNCTNDSLKYTGFSYYPHGIKLSRIIIDGESLIVKNTASNHDYQCEDSYVDEVADALVKFC
ncbi:MAG: hypothetical protein ACI4U3_10965 [Traorella sp.]